MIASRGLGSTLALAASDILAVCACAVASWWLKSCANPELPVLMYVHALPGLAVGAVAVYAMLGLYPGIGRGSADELRLLCQGTLLVFLVAVALTFLGQSGTAFSRQIFLVAWVLALAAVPLARWAVRRSCCRFPWWGLPVMVLGAGATGARVIELLRSRPWLGLRPVAVLDDDPAKHGQELGGLRVEGPLLAASERLADGGIHHGILAIPGLPPERLSAVLDALGGHLRHIYLAPALPGSPDVIAETREFANTLVLEVRQELLRPEARLVKRILDLLGAGIGGLLIAPFTLAIAIAIVVTSPGPVFYGQRRIGSGGREFTAWKFRSMVRDADAILARYLEEHPELRAEWERDHKLKDDPRITWVGRLLRRTSLDELPQLWNTLRGEMSLVGPRPIVAEEVAKYGERFGLYGKVLPGMSGLWQVSGRNDVTYAERVALDCYYVRNWSVWLDLVILARTVRVVLAGKGAY